MKTTPIEPARLLFDDDGLPRSSTYDDIYHPKIGALAQANHVFLGGSDLPARLHGRDRFVILETGFGLGNNFLATWKAWRADPQRCERLDFISIEKHPLQLADLQRVQRDPALKELATVLHAAWPPLTPNLHCLSFDGGKVRLLLALGDVHAWLPELVARVDAFYLDGFAPATNPQMWSARVCKALGRLAAPEATVATWTAAHAVRDALTTAGFEVRLAPGTGGKREITLARYAPRFMPKRSVATPANAPHRPRRALIIGAGLAGCAAAWALAEHGWTSRVIERRATIAGEASGNPAGLFHGIVNAQDGAHARFNRAAAQMAREAVQIAIDAHGAAGCANGLLRLETALGATDMQALLTRLGLPGDYVQAVDARRASELGGIALDHPAWFYPGGGWVSPAALAASFLARAGAQAKLHCGVAVQRLRRSANGWQLHDADGTLIDEAEVVVLANAGDALRLLDQPHWTMEQVRGQISVLPDAATRHGLALPNLPIAGTGYLLPAIDGAAIFGATAQAGDDDSSVRAVDHAANLAQLQKLCKQVGPIESADLIGRTAWRWSTSDRLPVIGAMPDAVAAQSLGVRLDQARFVPRLSGLYVFTALGSRGITWSALGAQVLASCISGAPQVVEASLLAAIDPARFISRAARRAG